MGTRADYYVNKDGELDWIGSSAYDGYPSGVDEILNAKSEEEFLEAVGRRLAKRDGTLPKQGWPWPWETSATTDYAYRWDQGQVYIACFGSGWVSARDYNAWQADYDAADEAWQAWHEAGEEGDEPQHPEPIFDDCGAVTFPDMTAIQNVTMGSRSGLLVFG